MSKYIDLTGQRFGKLVVLGKDTELSKEKGRSYVVVKCDCGTVKSVSKYTLTREKPITSCGCDRREKVSERMKSYHARNADKYPGMVGKVYGNLTVLAIDPTDKYSIVCMCKCGTIKSLSAQAVLSGNTTSCGCVGQSLDKILPNGTRFGHLTVIGNELEDHKRLYICRCDCGNVIKAWKCNLVRGTTSCGCMQDKSVYGRAMHEKSIERLQSLVGKRRGRLECISVDEADPKHITVKCDCGTVKKILKASFTKPSSNIYSCGCLQREVQRLPKRQRQAYIEQVKAAPAP